MGIPHSFFDDILGILPWKTRHGLTPNLAQGAWWSIQSKLGESYCIKVSEVSGSGQSS